MINYKSQLVPAGVLKHLHESAIMCLLWTKSYSKDPNMFHHTKKDDVVLYTFTKSNYINQYVYSLLKSMVTQWMRIFSGGTDAFRKTWLDETWIPNLYQTFTPRNKNLGPSGKNLTETILPPRFSLQIGGRDPRFLCIQSLKHLCFRFLQDPRGW